MKAELRHAKERAKAMTCMFHLDQESCHVHPNGAGERVGAVGTYQKVSGTRSRLQREDALAARELRARESSEVAILSCNLRRYLKVGVPLQH